MKEKNLEFMELREQICDYGKRIWQLGFVAANDGNISVKIDEDLYLCTPTGVSKGFMTPEMLMLVDKKCEKQEDCIYNPSSELLMHMRCYDEREDITAVIHAHPPVATAFAVAHIPLDKYVMPEAVLALGDVPIVPYGTPSTSEIPDNVAPYLKNYDAMMLENHGALTVGADLNTAYFKMETLEFYAKLMLNVKLIGQCHEIEDDKLDDLIDLRQKFKSTGNHPGIRGRK